MRLFRASATRPSDRATILFAIAAALTGLGAMCAGMAWSLIR